MRLFKDDKEKNTWHVELDIADVFLLAAILCGALVLVALANA